MSKIITITPNPCIDKTIWVDELIADKKLKAKHPEDEPGGGGINVSRAIKYLGFESTAIYFSGSYNGKYLDELIADEKINTVPISIQANTRMNLMLIDESTNKEYRIGMDGPTITEKEQAQLLKNITTHNAEIAVLSGSLPSTLNANFFASIASKLKYNNTKIIVDTSGAALQEVIKEKIFLLKPNLNELSILCGINENASITEIQQATQNLLLQINCTAIVVSLGGNGAILVTKEETHHITPPKVEVKSTVGAGDCMVAGLTLAISMNKSWKEILQYGVACGTAATLNSGKSLCRKEDVERILSLVNS
ncbi:MAG: 1-phosphofructokinase family hexose kinase [Bacteroidetes bacterium]|nr:1-phosphofructokinase family hexose kinase [Bacteroidota bacterium]